MSHIAHEVRVDRLILLSGPNVFAHLSNGDRACPTSIAPTHATGPARIYAYYNTNDGKAEDAERCHKAMNLAGRVPINSDYAASHAHVIFNPAPAHSKCPDGEENTGSSHVSTAKNCALEEPPDGGDLRPSRDQTHAVWDYLLRR
jgi:hypothetical protein